MSIGRGSEEAIKIISSLKAKGHINIVILGMLYVVINLIYFSKGNESDPINMSGDSRSTVC